MENYFQYTDHELFKDSSPSEEPIPRYKRDKNLPQVLAQDSPAFSPQNIPSEGNVKAHTLTNDRLLLASDEIKDLQILQDQHQEVTKFELESEFKKKFTSESEFLKDKSGTIKTSMLSVSGELQNFGNLTKLTTSEEFATEAKEAQKMEALKKRTQEIEQKILDQEATEFALSQDSNLVDRVKGIQEKLRKMASKDISEINDKKSQTISSILWSETQNQKIELKEYLTTEDQVPQQSEPQTDRNRFETYEPKSTEDKRAHNPQQSFNDMPGPSMIKVDQLVQRQRANFETVETSANVEMYKLKKDQSDEDFLQKLRQKIDSRNVQDQPRKSLNIDNKYLQGDDQKRAYDSLKDLVSEKRDGIGKEEPEIGLLSQGGHVNIETAATQRLTHRSAQGVSSRQSGQEIGQDYQWKVKARDQLQQSNFQQDQQYQTVNHNAVNHPISDRDNVSQIKSSNTGRTFTGETGGLLELSATIPIPHESIHQSSIISPTYDSVYNKGNIVYKRDEESHRETQRTSKFPGQGQEYHIEHTFHEKSRSLRPPPLPATRQSKPTSINSPPKSPLRGIIASGSTSQAAKPFNNSQQLNDLYMKQDYSSCLRSPSNHDIQLTPETDPNIPNSQLKDHLEQSKAINTQTGQFSLNNQTKSDFNKSNAHFNQTHYVGKDAITDSDYKNQLTQKLSQKHGWQDPSSQDKSSETLVKNITNSQQKVTKMIEEAKAPNFSEGLAHQIEYRNQVTQEIKVLQEKKSALESKEHLFEVCGRLQAEVKEKDFRIEYLERVGKEKDHEIRRLQMQILDITEQNDIKSQKQEHQIHQESILVDKLTKEQDEMNEQRDRLGAILREYFLDYEGHTKSSSLLHQISLLEVHISKMKNKELKRKINSKSRSRSRSKSNRITSIRCSNDPKSSRPSIRGNSGIGFYNNYSTQNQSMVSLQHNSSHLKSGRSSQQQLRTIRSTSGLKKMTNDSEILNQKYSNSNQRAQGDSFSFRNSLKNQKSQQAPLPPSNRQQPQPQRSLGKHANQKQLPLSRFFRSSSFASLR